MAKDDEILSEEKDAFERAVEAESENRSRAQEALRFNRLGEQWPEKIKQDRINSNRPVLTLNHAPAFIRQVVNDSRQNKPQITVKPVDGGADVATANVYKGLIKTIETQSKADIAYDTAVDFAASMGFSYIRVAIEYEHDDSFEKGLRIKSVPNPFSVYGDPDSEGADSTDWNRAFVTDLLTKEQFAARYKGAEEVNWASNGYDGLQGVWKQENSILVAESWSREETPREIVLLTDGVTVMGADEYKAGIGYFQQMGLKVDKSRWSKSHKVKQRIMTGAEVLEETVWAGHYIPIVPVYGEEVNVEGKRYFFSLTQHAMDAMRMHNYWRTTATEVVALAPRVPFIGAKGAFDIDPQKWATINTENHAYVEYKGSIPPQRQPLDTMGAAGSMQQAMAATDDMKAIIGLYDASLGQRSNETSGVAISNRRHEGDVSTFHFQDNLSRAIRHLGVVLVDLIPATYGKRQMLRILGEDGTEQTVQHATEARPVPKDQPALPPQPNLEQQVKGNAALTHEETGLEHVYDLGVGKYDVVVDTGPSFTTRREQVAAEMSEFLRAYPQAAPIVGDILVKSLDWPQADEISKRLKNMLPPQAAGGLPPELQKMMGDGQKLIQHLQQQLQQAGQENSTLKAQKQISDQVNALKLQEKDVQIQKISAVHAVQNAMPEAPQVTNPGFGPDQFSQALTDMGGLQIDAYDAETRRITALANAKKAMMPPAPKPQPAPGA